MCVSQERRVKPFCAERETYRMRPKAVDFFDHPRYRINKFLLSCNGQWPYQKKSQKIFLLSLTFMYSATSLPAQCMEAYIHRDDWSRMVPAMGPIFVHVGLLVKCVNSIVLCDKMRGLLNRIRSDWHAPMGPERKILERFADDGRYFTIMYAVWLYVSMVIYLAASTIPHVLLINGWANFTSTVMFAIPVHFTENDEDHYAIFQIHVCLAIFLVCSVSMAVDGMFVVFVQHACGIFLMVGYRLEHVIEEEDMSFDFHIDRKLDKPYWIVRDCIRKHQEALQFLNLLESAYSWSFLVLVGLNMLSISFTGLQMLEGASPDSIDEAIRQGLFVAAEILHLFFESFFSERLSNHFLEVYNSLTRTKWYGTSRRTRRLLQFMLMQSIVPWEFKAGKMYTMSMENFSAVLRTSLSYLTILGSIE